MSSRRSARLETGGWTVPLVMLLALALPLFALAAYVARPVYVEDQLPHRAPQRV